MSHLRLQSQIISLKVLIDEIHTITGENTSISIKPDKSAIQIGPDTFYIKEGRLSDYIDIRIQKFELMIKFFKDKRTTRVYKEFAKEFNKLTRLAKELYREEE